MISRTWILVLSACLFAATPAWPESDPPKDQKDAARERLPEGAEAGPSHEARVEPRASTTIVYVPPARGSVRASAGGGIRGGTMALPRPVVLAPPHVALTEQESPSLFWYLDRMPPAETALTFALIRADRIDPVTEQKLTDTSAVGIQRIRLSDLGVEIEPGVEYEWSVSLVSDPNDHSGDLVSTGWLRRVEKTAAVDGARDARAYAQKSLWYDALETLSDALDANPGDANLRAQRDDLLRQVDLP